MEQAGELTNLDGVQVTISNETPSKLDFTTTIDSTTNQTSLSVSFDLETSTLYFLARIPANTWLALGLSETGTETVTDLILLTSSLDQSSIKDMWIGS